MEHRDEVLSRDERNISVSISSAVSPSGDLYFMIMEGSMNSNNAIAFLDQLLNENEGFLYNFRDNIMIHKSKIVKNYPSAHNDRIITERIPVYFSELNPDKFVWDLMKYQELPNFCPSGIDELKSTVIMTLKRIRDAIRDSSLPLHPFMGIFRPMQKNWSLFPLPSWQGPLR